MSQSPDSEITQPQGAEVSVASQPIRATFGIACWVLGVIAFLQLITVGTALTVRSGQPRQVVEASSRTQNPLANTTDIAGRPIEPRSLDEILKSVEGSSSADAYSSPSLTAVPSTRPARTPIPAERTGNLPVIANPRAERLVYEARALHLEGDMMRAMLKLDEAGRLDSSEPAVIYHKALLFEDMGMLPKAADHYQQVQQLGIKAGGFYRLAASKLIKGMGRGLQKNDLVIGPLKARKATDGRVGRHVDISITLLGRPDKVVHADDVEVQVHFYDRLNNGEIKKADTASQITPLWGDNKVDWMDAGNEETLNVAYTVPEADLADAHLLGRREYYGFVVELIYKGEVVDQQAQPRRLHNIHGNKMRASPDRLTPMPMEDFPPDGGGLLPDLDDHYGENPSQLPLPTR